MRWRDIFAKDYSFITILTKQMMHENKNVAIHHIYTYSKYQLINDHFIEYIFEIMKARHHEKELEIVIEEDKTQEIKEQIKLKEECKHLTNAVISHYSNIEIT